MNTHRLLLLAIVSWWPNGAWPQQPARLPTVGILSPGAPVACESGVLGYVAACMVDGLRALGDVGGRKVAFEYRYAHGDLSRLPVLAAELVALRPDVLYTYTTVGAEAAAKATATIPIVVGPAGEPVMTRLAGSLARPAGNVTGQTLQTGVGEQEQKCLQLLMELAPRVSRVARTRNPDRSVSMPYQNALNAAAAQLGLTLVIVEARGATDLPQAFTAIAAARADAIFMDDDASLAGSAEVRQQISAWALGRRLPVVSSSGSFAADGALLSLGTDIPAIARRAAFQVHRILGGAKPAELPVERPTVFKLTLNRKTATALGLTVPQSLLLRADEVIQ